MRGHERATYDERTERLAGAFTLPFLLCFNREPMPIEWVKKNLEPSRHGALDPVEGAIWRVERDGKVETLAKWVRPDKIDGKYLPEVSGAGPVWNSYPAGEYFGATASE